MSKQQLPSDEPKQLTLAEQLDHIGEDQCIFRNDGESDADYAERIIYELDVFVEELWDCQDQVRELMKDEQLPD